MGIYKKALILSAFFVFPVSGFALGQSGGRECSAPVLLDPVPWRHVVDGDTLILKDGRKVRVLAVNAPELRYDARPHEQGAEQAKSRVLSLLIDSPEIYVRPGNPDRDRYGRLLANVYLADGRNLSELLIADGLAYHIVVPPNAPDWRCLAGIERRARQHQLGLWNKPAASVATSVTRGGFQLVRGTVLTVSSTKNYVWLELDAGLVVRIAHKDIERNNSIPGTNGLGLQLEVRGWVIDRHSQGAKLKAGYLRWMLPLRHPAMIRVIDPSE